jgi:hypothetical protein
VVAVKMVARAVEVTVPRVMEEQIVEATGMTPAVRVVEVMEPTMLLVVVVMSALLLVKVTKELLVEATATTPAAPVAAVMEPAMALVAVEMITHRHLLLTPSSQIQTGLGLA